MEYLVKRQHYGKKEYYEGDTRELSPEDARQLIDLGVIEEIKKKPSPENKMQPEPRNKAAKISRKKPKN